MEPARASQGTRPINRWTARLKDAQLERAYRRYAVETGGHLDRLLMISGAAAHVGYALLDWFAVRDIAPAMNANRFIAASLMVALWAFSFTNTGRRFHMWLSLAIAGIAIISTSILIHQVGSPSPPYYVGLIHVGVGFSALGRITFRANSALLLLITAGFFWSVADLPKTPALVTGQFFVIGTFMSCAMSNYFLETNRRIEFLTVREKEIYYVQVQAMADEAKQSLRRKNALLNVLGHVVKTPLHQMIGYAQLIEQTARQANADADEVAFAEEISRAGQALTHQSQRILDYARADAGLISATPQKTNVARVVAEVMYRHEDTIAEKRLDLHNEVEGLDVVVDVRHVVRAFDEVLDNAVRYSPPGTEIHLYTETEADRVILCLRDAGPGIAEGDVDRIGDALNRTEEFRNVGGDKLGIGVSLARILAEIGQAKVLLSSFPGQGTLVQIIMPRREVESPAEADASLTTLSSAA